MAIGVDLPEISDQDVLYHYRLGVFHAVWSTIDVTVDYAIGKFLGVPHAEAHLVTWGMMHGPKVKLLAKLIKRSDAPNKAAILTALNAIRGDTKRDIIAHGYPLVGDRGIAFVERSRGSQDFSTKHHHFTHAEFREHVERAIKLAHDFGGAMGHPFAEIGDFVDAARSLESKSSTSP